MVLKFEKQEGRWYVELPTWTGSHDDLEMVYGADDLLEVMSQAMHQKEVAWEIWTSKPDVPCAWLHKIEETLDGATYQVYNCLYYNSTVWLCNVTKFVFNGFHPNDIYFRAYNSDCDISSESNEKKAVKFPEQMQFKKIKIEAANLDVKKSVALTIDIKDVATCETENAVKKAIEDKILEAKVFSKADLPKLKYKGRKDVIEEWKTIRPLVGKVPNDETDKDCSDNTSPLHGGLGGALDRFLSAQEYAYPEALEEIRNGHKYGHWIWYIFPQQKGLGHSYNSEYYGLDGIDEARAYIEHPILGARLREISEALLQHCGKDIYHIMGSDIDAIKLETCMKLFDKVSPNDVFDKVLRQYFRD